jgi:hypothetical protein
VVVAALADLVPGNSGRVAHRASTGNVHVCRKANRLPAGVTQGQ